MGTPYGDLYREVVHTNPAIEPSSGGYFVAPKGVLDERLFEGDIMREDVRQTLLGLLYGFWRERYNDPESWSTAWLAGSQITPQWRERGDLDVLIGIDMARFFKANPHLRGFPQKMIAKHLNSEMKEHLWPTTENWQGWAEVTFYVNPGTGNDIRSINPYAAYNLTTGEWSVTPPDVPEDWSEQSIPKEWRKSVGEEIEQARRIVQRFEEGKARLGSYREDSPGWVNAMHEVHLVVEQAKALFESIHEERRNAFQGVAGVPGQGFFDYYNYRWQAHKRAGTVKALSTLKNAAISAAQAKREARYGTSQIMTEITPGTLPRGY